MPKILQRLIAAYGRFSQNDGTLLAAAIAYYLAFSLFPLMLVLVAAIGWGFRATAAGHNAQQRVLAAVAEQASPELSEHLATALSSVSKSAPTSGVIGVVVLIAAALALFTQIDYAFDRIWETTSVQGGWRERILNIVFTRLKALLMLMGVGAFVIAVMISSIVWQGIEANLPDFEHVSPWVLRVVQPLIHIVLNLLAFTVLFRFLPKSPPRWRAALAGALLASALWEVGRQLLAAYVVADKLPTAYGLIGSFMAIMLWTYYAMLVLLFGAAYTRTVDEAAEQVVLDHP